MKNEVSKAVLILMHEMMSSMELLVQGWNFEYVAFKTTMYVKIINFQVVLFWFFITTMYYQILTTFNMLKIIYRRNRFFHTVKIKDFNIFHLCVRYNVFYSFSTTSYIFLHVHLMCYGINYQVSISFQFWKTKGCGIHPSYYKLQISH